MEEQEALRQTALARRNMALLLEVCSALYRYTTHSGLFLPHSGTSRPQRGTIRVSLLEDILPDNCFILKKI